MTDTMINSENNHPDLTALQRDNGTFAMVALDQRGSLREMLSTHGRRVTDSDLQAFKTRAAEILSPQASAVLIDAGLGFDNGRPPRLHDGCALVLAADRFDQPAGMPVQMSDLDPAITPDIVRQVGAKALKFLLIYRHDSASQQRADVVGQFLDLSRQSGVPSILEAVTRPIGDEWADSAERDEAIAAAAVELGTLGPSLYKAEVPDYGQRPDVVETNARQITSALDCPWVVLSTGVKPDDFPAAVTAAAAGGASGFLAGRAIWSQAATEIGDIDALLRTGAVSRLQKLIDALPA